MSELDEAVRFHGHLCPMFYLGVRMGNHALKGLGRGRDRGVKLHTVVEFANCFGDGIQYVTGSTFGKNNLHLKDRGKFAASFYDLETGKGLRLSIKAAVVERVLEYGKAGKDVKSLPPGERKEETQRLMARGRETVEWLKNLDDEGLFEESMPPEDFKPPDGPSLDYVICQGCGEVTLIEQSEDNLCSSCTPS